MASSWVRPKQAPDDEIEVFGLGEPDAEDDTGDVLQDRYELLEVLACGATATVYRARDLTTKSIVAVKVLYRGALAAVGEFFNQEARLAARIRSPHLVHASDFGEDDGRPFIVFDMVPGEALSELYCEKLMPWRELCLVVLDLLAALAELHRRGITHRDVKPDNVFVLRTLDEQIHVTLLDLGFAAVPPERRLTGAPVPSRKVFGTFGFIAPEMLAGALPEPRSDLYSVGALMYVMLTGQHVPDLRAAPDLICIPSPRVFVPTLPDAVDGVVMRALSDVDIRFQSAAEMAAMIRAALAGVDAEVRRETHVPPGAEPSPPTAAPTAGSGVSDDDMRPFREAPTVKVARPEERLRLSLGMAPEHRPR
jgi:serine/threonine protein kinase